MNNPSPSLDNGKKNNFFYRALLRASIFAGCIALSVSATSHESSETETSTTVTIIPKKSKTVIIEPLETEAKIELVIGKKQPTAEELVLQVDFEGTKDLAGDMPAWKFHPGPKLAFADDEVSKEVTLELTGLVRSG